MDSLLKPAQMLLFLRIQRAKIRVTMFSNPQTGLYHKFMHAHVYALMHAPPAFSSGWVTIISALSTPSTPFNTTEAMNAGYFTKEGAGLPELLTKDRLALSERAAGVIAHDACL